MAKKGYYPQERVTERVKRNGLPRSTMPAPVSPPSTEFAIENLLPRAEVEFAFGHRDYQAPSLPGAEICCRGSCREAGIIQRSEKARGEKTHGLHACRPPWFEQRPFSSKTRVIGRPRYEMADYELQPGCPRHGQMGIKGRFSLQQFSEVFKVRNSEAQITLLSRTKP